MRIFKAKSIFLIIFFVLLTLCAWFYLPIDYNLHTIIPGQAYRSAILSKKQLEYVVSSKHIKSIINLRNAHPESLWYRDEIAITKKNNIQFYNLSLPSRGLPRAEQLLSLYETIAKAKKPILIHCRYGIDRSGLAAAFVLIISGNYPFSEVEKQISWRYFVFSTQSVGKQVLPLYKTWLTCRNLSVNAKSLYSWLKSPYALEKDKLCIKST